MIFKKYVAYGTILIIALVIVGTLAIERRCDWVESTNTSISIEAESRAAIGFNADTDSLKFGKISPTASVRRSIKVSNEKDVRVTASMDSPYANWTTIAPNGFEIRNGESQEIGFTVTAPANAGTGDYEGKVYFCFKEI